MCDRMNVSTCSAPPASWTPGEPWTPTATSSAPPPRRSGRSRDGRGASAPGRRGNASGAAGCGSGRLGANVTPTCRARRAATQLATALDVGSDSKPTGKQPAAVTARSRRRCSRCRRAAGDGELGVEDRLEAQRHRAVEHLRVDALAVHVLDADPVEEAADRGLRMDRPEGALARALGLREDALEVAAAGRGSRSRMTRRCWP